jgi:2-oxoglutarate dehydrogenase E2 component (dihydrolipoamide succinyltransferase)
MIIDVVMPKMGESIMEGTILRWLKKTGDKVERDESLLEISTDKVDTEVPAPESGIIAEILFQENQVVEVGKVIARISTEAEIKDTIIPANAAPAKVEITAEKPLGKEEPKKSEEEIAAKEIPQSNRFYSPLVLNIASKEGISLADLEKIKGSGTEGRVTKKDILDFIKDGKQIKSEPVPETKEVVSTPDVITPKPEIKKDRNEITQKHVVDYNEDGLSVLEFDNIRQKMAEHMVESVAISPHVNAFAEVDLTNVEKARNKLQSEFQKTEGFKLTYMPFIADAVVKALKDFPLINSVIDESTKPFRAIMRSKINLGFAVAMENGGLIVPVIKNSDGKNLIGLARDIYDLGKRAKVKKLTLDEIQGGTFTISNFGVFGNIFGTMIINQPQVAILGIGAVKKRPAVIETPDGDFVVIKPIMYLTLSFDHRLIDGALGGQFVMRIAHYLENYQI